MTANSSVVGNFTLVFEDADNDGLLGDEDMVTSFTGVAWEGSFLPGFVLAPTVAGVSDGTGVMDAWTFLSGNGFEIRVRLGTSGFSVTNLSGSAPPTSAVVPPALVLLAGALAALGLARRRLAA